MHDLGLGVEVRLFSDSSAALGIIRRSGIGKIKHLAIKHLWVQDYLREGFYTENKIPTALNPADIFTKHKDRDTIKNVLDKSNLIISLTRPNEGLRIYSSSGISGG